MAKSDSHFDFKAVTEAVRKAITAMARPCLSKPLMQALASEVERLCDEGKVDLGEDCFLSGKPLEWRVKRLFQQMGFDISRGREGMEDYVVRPPKDHDLQTPLVVEVKSSKNPRASLDALRQLDDWVFDLSGEGRVRKAGAGTFTLTVGGLSPIRSPHKGVLVFNGPLSSPFDKRNTSCLEHRGVQFCDKHYICVIPLNVLVSYANLCCDGVCASKAFWKHVHESSGCLQSPRDM